MNKLITAAICTVILAGSLLAKHKHKQEHAYFAANDRGVIFEYVRGPGHGKHEGGLPPGLAKQLQRRGHLPPGLEKKLVPFPVELDRRLAPLPPGLCRGFIGDRAIIYEPASTTIFDIMVVVGH